MAQSDSLTTPLFERIADRVELQAPVIHIATTSAAGPAASQEILIGQAGSTTVVGNIQATGSVRARPDTQTDISVTPAGGSAYTGVGFQWVVEKWSQGNAGDTVQPADFHTRLLFGTPHTFTTTANATITFAAGTIPAGLAPGAGQTVIAYVNIYDSTNDKFGVVKGVLASDGSIVLTYAVGTNSAVTTGKFANATLYEFATINWFYLRS